MFEHPLPLSIKPLKLARQEGKLTGHMPLARLQNLAADCVTAEGLVEADLQLYTEQGWPALEGSASARVQLVCQRCLEPVTVPLAVEIALGFVQGESQLQSLPESLEPFLLEAEEIPLAELLEQELILALPIVAYHDHCEPIPYQEQAPGDSGAQEEKPNPFAVLEQLKGKVDKSDK
ncbi:MAG: YceD family protein [Pseudomonadota bacterium]|nr:YceD family protein [Pseudomonadota bacterium]